MIARLRCQHVKNSITAITGHDLYVIVFHSQGFPASLSSQNLHFRWVLTHTICVTNSFGMLAYSPATVVWSVTYQELNPLR